MLCVCVFMIMVFSSDVMKLHRTKEQHDRLHVENQTLRERVHTLESEKTTLLDQVGV